LIEADLLRQYNADVYVLVRRQGKLVEYSSSEDPNWPLTKVQIVSFQCQTQTELTSHQAQCYPLPKKETPAMHESMHMKGKRCRRREVERDMYRVEIAVPDAYESVA
jgi:hypothetical protein